MQKYKSAKYYLLNVLIILALILTLPKKSHAEIENVMSLQVKKGDTLSGILSSADISKKDALQVTKALKTMYDPANLKVGQKLKIKFDIEGSNLKLTSLHINLSSSNEIAVSRFKEGFLARKIIYKTSTKLVKASGVINTTLFSAIKKAGIPNRVREKFIKNYSYDVDFQRDIRKGDKFELLYEGMYNKSGDFVKSGDIIYSSLNVKRRQVKMYYFTTPDGRRQYYDEDGESIQKSFLRTPIDGGRITSGFGRRRHPILGYSKAHKGVDFGANRGTPIYAAGDGVVIERRRKGSYGNYIKIFHSHKYSTAYAHLNNFARRLKKGSKVKQGQIIGYVGSTGRSTGPHLHYEVLRYGKQINPLSIKTVSGRKLKSLELAIFNKYKKDVRSLINGHG